MGEPLPEISKILLSLIRQYPGITGEYVLLHTGFEHDKCIDAIKGLVLRELVYLKFDDDLEWFDPHFLACRFYPKY